MTASNLQCLVFKYLQEPFGIDVEQIAALLEMDKAPDVEWSYFHELFYGHSGHVPYQHPQLLLIKGAKQAGGIVIERPDKIVDVSLENIRPLPPFVALCNKHHPLWGVAVLADEWFFLVDLYRFAGRAVKKNYLTRI